jgi:hypothetical protein
MTWGARCGTPDKLSLPTKPDMNSFGWLQPLRTRARSRHCLALRSSAERQYKGAIAVGAFSAPEQTIATRAMTRQRATFAIRPYVDGLAGLRSQTYPSRH